MHIWTYQTGQGIVDAILSGVPYRCDESLSEYNDMAQFRAAYEWMSGKMADTIGPPPDGIVYPIWGTSRYDFVDGACPPDEDMLGYDSDGLRIELDVPDDMVLLSDEDKWDLVVNGWLIGDGDDSTGLSDDAFDDDWELTQKAQSGDADAIASVHESWDKVFDVTICHSDSAWRGRYVQATFWEMRPEWILGVQDVHTGHEPSDG